MTATTGPAPAQPTTSGEQQERREKFIQFVQRMCLQPGHRSALRSGLGRRPEQAPRMHALVARWVSSDRGDIEWAYYTVAALIAAQPPSARDDASSDDQPEAELPTEASADHADKVRFDNLGRTLALAVAKNQMTADGTEKRLHLLTRQPVDGLHRHLPALVRHLRTDNVPINWVQLLDDLSRWRYQRDRVAKRWLQTYYRTLDRVLTTPDTNAESPEE